MKLFIPWAGGKSLPAKKITSLFPDNADRYIKVFGGGSVLFYKEKHADLEVYNGFNSCLVNLFCCAKYRRENLFIFIFYSKMIKNNRNEIGSYIFKFMIHSMKGENIEADITV